MARIKLAILICAYPILFGYSAAWAEDKCEQAGSSGYQQIDSVYDPKIQLFMKVSGALKTKGFDPKRYPYVTPTGDVEPVDLVELLTNLVHQKAKGYVDVRDAVDSCNNGFKTPQKIVDVATFIVTGGLSAVLPERMSHVDFSRLTSGTPFGGPNALIPKLRDDALNGLGIGGDVACIIRDPKKIFGGC
jgi:hypothetical protein